MACSGGCFLYLRLDSCPPLVTSEFVLKNVSSLESEVELNLVYVVHIVNLNVILSLSLYFSVFYTLLGLVLFLYPISVSLFSVNLLDLVPFSTS